MAVALAVFAPKVESALSGAGWQANGSQSVQARTLIVSADDDVIALEHTLELYRGIPDAELAVVPGTSHVLILEKPQLVARLVLDFLTTDPVETRVPIRRRT